MLIIAKGHERQNLRIFIKDFLNSDFSINTCSIPFKFLEYDVYSLLEGSMSQNVDLSPSFFLCYVEI